MSLTEEKNGESGLESGDLAIDEDADDNDLLLVLAATDTRADKEVIYEMPPGDPDITVATRNPDYDPDERVIDVVYLSSLDRHFDDWNASEVIELYEEGTLEDDDDVTVYGFPKTRLSSASA